MNATCTYCGSKKHSSKQCIWAISGAPKPPTITIKELSYLLSLARKNMCKEFGYDSIEVSECFTEIRKQLNLRKRGRK